MVDLRPALPSDLALAEDDAALAVRRYWRSLATPTRAVHTTNLKHLSRMTGGAYLLPEGIPDLHRFAGVNAPILRWCCEKMTTEGRSPSSIRLFTAIVSGYVRRAFNSGIVDMQQFVMVQEAARDERRMANAASDGPRLPHTRRPPLVLHLDQQLALLQQPETVTGRRDALIMAMGLLLGLRLGELAGAQLADVDLAAGEIQVTRMKTGRQQRLTLLGSSRLLAAMQRYLIVREVPGLTIPDLLVSIRHDVLLNKPLGRSVAGRVRELGSRAGIEGLSPHDCRHSWATTLSHAGTDTIALRDSGGWSSVTQAAHYAERATIANANAKFPEELR